MPAFILEHTENKRRKQLVIEKDRILVGRTAKAEIPLADGGVSKTHLVIEKSESGYLFHDLGSRNGTVHNHQKVSHGELRHGDTLLVGRIRITVLLDPELKSRRPGLVVFTVGTVVFALGIGLGVVIGMATGDGSSSRRSRVSHRDLSGTTENSAALQSHSRRSAAVAETPPPAPSKSLDFPGLISDPLGPYVSSKESLRVLFRLFLDLLGRPPTRAEVREMLPLPHEARWDRLAPESPLLADPGRLSRLFLGREPNEEELLSLTDWTLGDLERLGLVLTCTEEYRSEEHQREKNLQQKARSIIVDFLDRVPESRQEVELVEEAILEANELDVVTRIISTSSVSRLASLPESADLGAWIRSETFRFLQRYPDALEEQRLAEFIGHRPEAVQWFRQSLAAAAEYGRY